MYGTRLRLEGLQADKERTAIIVSSDGGYSWQAPMLDDLSLELTPEYTTLMPKIEDVTGGSIVPAINSTLAYTNFTSMTIFNVGQTRKKWQVSNNGEFTLQLLFVATSDYNSQVKEPIKNFMDYTHPLSASDVLVEPPKGYTGGDDQKGMVSVQIGNWFKADKLIIESVMPIISKGLVEGSDGKVPRYAQVTVRFARYQMPTASEIKEWFI